MSCELSCSFSVRGLVMWPFIHFHSSASCFEYASMLADLVMLFESSHDVLISLVRAYGLSTKGPAHEL